MSTKTKGHRGIWLSVWCVVLALVIGFNCWATSYALSWDKVLTGYFGIIETKGQEQAETTQETSENKYATLEELAVAEKEAELEIVSEGMVLLKNDNDALPLAKGSKVSVFGQTAQMWMTKEKLTNTKDTVFLESLEAAGLEINGTLRKMYKQSKHTKWGNGANLGNGGIAGAWAVDEVPQSEYKESTVASYADYADAAIIVLTRGGSEGGDLPRYMDRFGGAREQSYLDLSQEEKDLLKAVSGSGFARTIVVLHTTNALNLEELLKEEYGVDAIVWISGTGQDGIEEVGKLFVGDINPSGHTVDTWAYNNFSAPAMQNFGDFRFTRDGEPIQATTTTVGGTYSFQNYAENIYVGYRYYETRYEDAVMGSENVGVYDYDTTVAYPFGWGLSYTTFDWSDFAQTAPDGDGNMTLSVKVTNSGNRAGKDVVQLYYQSPYTAYDKENGVEKAAVNLLDFGKTAMLQPGESETVSLTVNLYDMVSYDSHGAKTYILDDGDYYVTLAANAHEATENILAAKGFATSGRKEMTMKHTVEKFTVCSQAANGNEITNLFDDMLLPDAVYLSRSNWSVLGEDGLRYANGTLKGLSETMDGEGFVYTHEASDAVYTALSSEGWAISGNPKDMNDASYSTVQYGVKGDLTLDDMTGKAWDDPAWDKLLDQMTQDEQVDLVGRAMNATNAVDSIGKSVAYYMDGPQGMIDYVSGGTGYQFTDENMLAATWNKELSHKMADLCTQEFALKGATTWWSPAVNIHRTAYSGRNFEYFAEDGVFSGLMGREWVLAAKANGVNCQVKHFFMNDQEANRGANGRLAVFATEQAMREIYAKPFQMCIEGAGAAGVMLSMARVGTTIAPGNYALCTVMLRDEWGMTGAIITDAQSLTLYEAEQSLAAGCDMVDTAMRTEYPAQVLASPGGQQALRQATKHILYMEANSAAVEITVATGYPIYKLLLIVYNVLTFIYMAWATLEILRKLYPEKKFIGKKALKVLRIVLGVIGIAILAVLLYMFFTQWLPMLQFALQTAV
ncbi:MAG: glycoside hydrolase family 3 C-terminal domain-containing protein [Clostridia bacterium]|nr:glycoside hydrolase family 3 C-terminal domain-containing protein [Clostridia bacterium]